MTSVLPYVTGSAGALVVLAVVSYFFFIGKLHSDAEFQKLAKENEDLRVALEAERRAVNEVARTGEVTSKLIEALLEVSAQRKATAPRPRQRRELTGEDLGL